VVSPKGELLCVSGGKNLDRGPRNTDSYLASQARIEAGVKVTHVPDPDV
jgi:hypothetical protein